MNSINATYTQPAAQTERVRMFDATSIALGAGAVVMFGLSAISAVMVATFL